MPRHVIESLCIIVLIAGCLFGGSGAPDRALLAIPELLSLPLLVLLTLARTAPGARMRIGIAVTILGLPALQLIPFPPQVWTLLPGRSPVADAYAAANVTLPWLPISLTPRATEQVWLGLLPAVALFLAVPYLSIEAQRRLMHVAIGLGVLDVILGLAQVAGGAESPLLLYDTASRTDAVGLFANRNHQATFLSILVVLVGALAFGRPRAQMIERVWLATAGALLLLGIAASGSRAGLALGLGASLAVAWTAISVQRSQGKRASMLFWGGIASGAFLVGAVAAGTSVLRLQTESFTADLRWQIVRTTWHAIGRAFPVGGGFGSFERLYAQVEPPGELIPAIINHAHNDWLELVLEGGLPALLLLAMALAYLIRETLLGRRGSEDARWSAALQSTTLAALWLCALHATVDFSLRTMAVNLVLALACGLRAAVSAKGETHLVRSGAGRERAAAADRRVFGPNRSSRRVTCHGPIADRPSIASWREVRQVVVDDAVIVGAAMADRPLPRRPHRLRPAFR